MADALCLREVVHARSDSSICRRSGRLELIQQGQVFKLKAKGADGQPLWAYRYRLEGRSSARPQVGGFASRAEAQKALRKALERIGPGRGGAITLVEFR